MPMPEWRRPPTFAAERLGSASGPARLGWPCGGEAAADCCRSSRRVANAARLRRDWQRQPRDHCCRPSSCWEDGFRSQEQHPLTLSRLLQWFDARGAGILLVRLDDNIFMRYKARSNAALQCLSPRTLTRPLCSTSMVKLSLSDWLAR